MKRDPSGYWKMIGIKGDVEGHPFRGNQYTTGAGGEEMLHGTTTAKLDSILKEGITPQKQRNWHSSFFAGNRRERVFLTTAKETAMDYAADALQQLFKNPDSEVKGMPRCCVLRVHVPAGEVLEEDFASAIKEGDHYMIPKVPAEWIKGYDLYDFNPFKGTFKHVESKELHKSAARELYVPVFWVEEDAADED